ncbi:MAG: hypothetical protein ACK4MU_08545, partial [Thermomonas sp.]
MRALRSLFVRAALPLLAALAAQALPTLSTPAAAQSANTNPVAAPQARVIVGLRPDAALLAT